MAGERIRSRTRKRRRERGGGQYAQPTYTQDHGATAVQLFL